jgi:hypothetical protein
MHRLQLDKKLFTVNQSSQGAFCGKNQPDNSPNLLYNSKFMIILSIAVALFDNLR